METLIYLKHNNTNNIDFTDLIDNFISNVNKSLKLLLSNDNEIILDNSHILKGFFGSNKLKELLDKKNGAKNIKQNYSVIKKLIDIELKKLE